MTGAPAETVSLPPPAAPGRRPLLHRAAAGFADRLRRGSVIESRAVLLKEMLQVGHRGWFHAENFLIVAITAGYTAAILAVSLTESLLGAQQLRAVGRELFLVLSVMTAIFSAWISLSVASGIILSEITGKRISLLRITSLSLGAVVVGKGLAVLARATMAVAVMVPIWAALQLLGGVSQGDVLQAFALILGGMFVSTGIGLWASAGSRSGFGRFLRAAFGVALWASIPLLAIVVAFVLTLLVEMAGFGDSLRGGLGSFLDSAVPFISPVVAWPAFVGGLMSGPHAAVFMAVQAVGGLLFARRAARVLERNVIRAEELSSQPKVKDLAPRREAAAPAGAGLASRARAYLGAVLYRWKGTLVGCQVLQSNLVAILLPVGLATGMLPSYLAMLSQRGSLQSTDAAGMAAGQILLVLSAGVGIEACSLLAKEKARRTAEVLATTPAAGPRMVLWKGAALAAGQSVGLVGLIAIILVRQLHWPTGCFSIVLLEIIALPVLAFALGISLSLLSRTPMQAMVIMLLTVFVFTPLAGQFIRIAGEYAVSGRPSAHDALLAFVFGIVLVLGRNALGLFAFPSLCAGTAFALGAIAILMGGRHDLAFLSGVAWIHESRMPDGAGEMLRHSALMMALSAALLVGVFFRFEQRFLLGARAGE